MRAEGLGEHSNSEWHIISCPEGLAYIPMSAPQRLFVVESKSLLCPSVIPCQ